MGYNPRGCKETNTTEHVHRVSQGGKGKKKQKWEKIEAGENTDHGGVCLFCTQEVICSCVCFLNRHR